MAKRSAKRKNAKKTTRKARPQRSDFPTEDTLDFIAPLLGKRTRKVLEVGCGEGRLAARLSRAGHRVVALDSDARAVARARRSGVDARLATWPEFEIEGKRSYDAILFTRSLHHVADLEGALDRAVALLSPRGLVLVEDFAFDALDALGAAWLHGVLQLLDASGWVDRRAVGFGQELLRSGPDLELWRRHHGHVLHSDRAILLALRQRFPAVTVEHAPHLYRYAAALLSRGRDGSALVRHLHAQEQRLIRDHGVSPLGRRMIARRQPAAPAGMSPAEGGPSSG